VKHSRRIAEVAGVKVGEVRAVLKAAGAQTAASPDALGAASGAVAGDDAVGNGGTTVNGAAAQALGAGAARTDGETERG
jgi:hypothetical protein